MTYYEVWGWDTFSRESYLCDCFKQSAQLSVKSILVRVVE